MRKTYAARTKTPGDYGNTPQAAALRRQLAGLAQLEEEPFYLELCAEADERRRAESALPRKANGVVVTS